MLKPCSSLIYFILKIFVSIFKKGHFHSERLIYGTCYQRTHQAFSDSFRFVILFSSQRVSHHHFFRILSDYSHRDTIEFKTITIMNNDSCLCYACHPLHSTNILFTSLIIIYSFVSFLIREIVSISGAYITLMVFK